MKSTIASLSILLVLVASPLSAAGGYEQKVKEIAERLPRPLDKGETINDWWPLENGITYEYKVVGGSWEHNNKAIGTVFTIEISKDDANENLYRFKVDGFSEFPYSGLKVKGNRVFLLNVEEIRGPSDSRPTTRIHETPFAVFPLFDGMMFHGLEEENHFLRQTIMRTTDHSYYAPVNNGMSHVRGAQEPDLYTVTQAIHAPANYSFKRGVGPVEWGIEGGSYLELVSHSLREGKQER